VFFVFLRYSALGPITWLSLISRLGISKLNAISPSFKHFKDGFFKGVVKEPGCSLFYNEDGSTKFPFSWTDNLWRYKDMKREELSVVDREVMEVLMRFSDKMPTKGLVRVYLSMHPLVNLKGITLYFHRHILCKRDNRYCLCCRLSKLRLLGQRDSWLALSSCRRLPYAETLKSLWLNPWSLP